jgi:RNA polymerase sigma-70 factor (ECF subfamily)
LKQHPGTGAEDPILVSLLLRAQHERANPVRTDPTPVPAFADFVGRTQQRLGQSVLPLVHGDRHQAEDVVQETYLKLWKWLRNFSPARLGPGGVHAFLMRIARNTAISHGRRSRPLVGLDFLGDGDDNRTSPLEPRSPEPGPPVQAQLNQQDERIHEAITALRPDKRELVQMHYRDELSHKEMARRCGLTAGQVNMMLYAARQEIRPQVEKYLVQEPE